MYDCFKWTTASLRRNRLTQEYEPLQPFFLRALAERTGCETFVDIGANIGAYSLFATLVPTVRRVIAFEADRGTAEELDRNVVLNGLERHIEVQSLAISDAVGVLTFGHVGYLSGANSVIATSIHNSTRFHDEYPVESTTLDDFFASRSLGAVALKVDVEGHELAVLNGGSCMLQQHPSIVQIEYYEESGDQTRKRLRHLGFKQITAIGPDHYFTNIEALQAPSAIIEIYERAVAQMIAYYHRDQPLVLQRGHFRLELGGKGANVVRRLSRLVRR